MSNNPYRTNHNLLGLWESCADVERTGSSQSFCLTFAPQLVIMAAESFRAGLRRSHLDRRPVVSQPPSFPESLRSNDESPYTFGVKIEHVLCASVRRCSTVSQSKTTALSNEFSGQRSTGRCGIRGVFISPSSPRCAPVLYESVLNKSGGGKQREAKDRIQEGSGGVSA